MNYSEAERYLLSLVDERRSRGRLGLDRMRALLRELGNPHEAYPTVHVGGTSGKGSTSTMIASALAASGKRTGLHVKPHLHSMTERACIDGEPIEEQRFAELLAGMLPSIERVTAIAGRPSYYEVLLALAFLYFARECVEAAVIEVGLGGRLDGTNVIVPEVAVITSVDYDHTDVLGDTIEAIAAEKAGIAKPNVPLVVGTTNAQALTVIERVASRVNAPVIRIHDVTSLELLRGDGRHFRVKTARASYDVSLSVFGSFQRENARCAIVTLEALPEKLRPNVADVSGGLGEALIPGRMEIVEADPVVVLDIAHNAEKARHLVEALRERFPSRRVRAVVAVGHGKDAKAIVTALAPIAGAFVFTTFAATGRHALSPEDLLEYARAEGIRAEAISDPTEAFSHACEQAEEDEIILVTGSTFIVSELRQAVLSGASLDPSTALLTQRAQDRLSLGMTRNLTGGQLPTFVLPKKWRSAK
jgi:dihydrofolate synthase/folylpolyglutamate synthase